MSSFTRTDTSLLGRWWWTIDRWNLAALAALTAIGAVLTLAASPPVAARLGLDTFYFARRQMIYLPMALIVMLAISLAAPRGVRRLATACFVISLVLTALTLVTGTEVKGAVRWLSIDGMSLQPSEFLKPGFAVVAAWLFAESHRDETFPGRTIASVLCALVCLLLLMQPDVGMTVVVAAVWGTEFFLAGLPLAWVMILGAGFVVGGIGAYFAFGHVQVRVDHFLNPASGDQYQVSRALAAFRHGGLFGLGPGEGHIKDTLPDAHADFVLAVAGEEFGLIACLMILGLFAFIVLRGLARAIREDDLFIMLAVSGLLVEFGLQTIINMASTLHMIPPKGMTLPFISYGGSSILALAVGMGMVLALTRERPGRAGEP